MWSRPQNQLHHFVTWDTQKLLQKTHCVCQKGCKGFCQTQGLPQILAKVYRIPALVSCTFEQLLQIPDYDLYLEWDIRVSPTCNPLLVIHCLLCIKGMQQPFWGWHGKKIKQGEANFDTNKRRKYFSELAITAPKSTWPVMPRWGFREAHLPCRVNTWKSCVSPTKGRKYTGYCTTHKWRALRSNYPNSKDGKPPYSAKTIEYKLEKYHIITIPWL